MELELAQRITILASQVLTWPKETSQDKNEILGGVCRVTGWYRDHAHTSRC
ncbi:hypothetical protein HMPREF9622_01568 [Cutibacterium modestum HL037PA3]|uniref:Uncharacterized protein n=2 Tax=Cutibacterium modestum TaxID=2559073 RepID=A0AAD1KRA7_9ACTN|nr:hypothetical protein HMPREF9621_01646 [Cutibacterium modestum HL037PA2]EFS92689.1 hypothetical protein HMPREF9607_01220 [Cutibacterium modestum HL044PA1]EFT15362.1 hypothetical protein HMPREF9622_01568 [Cutibacterium modestum HL037PA3]EGG26170.1 hypothetical protein PA08_2135 [Cutibacterium modestum P08]BCY26162.1 hypothetical protein KB1_21520 [Cutibacterium modestum]